jgi:hypothetical protein
LFLEIHSTYFFFGRRPGRDPIPGDEAPLTAFGGIFEDLSEISKGRAPYLSVPFSEVAGVKLLYDASTNPCHASDLSFKNISESAKT